MKKEVRQIWYFNNSPEEVWEYLTQPELIGQWLGETDFRPVVGHRFRFMSPNGNHARCEVLEVARFTRLSYTWEKLSPASGIACTSRVRWTLSPKDNGTELFLEHNGFATEEDAAGHDKGWTACLQQVEKLLKNVNR